MDNILKHVVDYFESFLLLLNEMSFYLLIGFFFAGLLHVFFPAAKIKKFLGKGNFRSVFNSALVGIPLPLCSCGVIPTGVSLFKSGASRGSSVSFLISTPQTGVDSIFVTYSLLGLPFAIIRPIIALFTGIGGGIATNIFMKKSEKTKIRDHSIGEEKKYKNPVRELFRYAFGDFLDDISKWLIIGLLLAAFIDVVIPDNFFEAVRENWLLNIAVILAAAIPLYVCATGSVPIAAVLLMKGISPGAAIVFLMVGPATNIATITVIGKVLGRKNLFLYLFTIIAGALFFAYITDFLLPTGFFNSTLPHHHGEHQHGLLPGWLEIASGIILGGLLLLSIFRKYYNSLTKTGNSPGPEKSIMNAKDVKVSGMTCNHCKMNVEKAIGSIEGIKKVTVDLANSSVHVEGDKIDTRKIKEQVEDIGYKYQGEIN
ncbi:MAG: permease [bacterium]